MPTKPHKHHPSRNYRVLVLLHDVAFLPKGVGWAHLVLDRKVDEVGIHQHLVGGPQLRVVLEKERRRHLLPAPPTSPLVRISGWYCAQDDARASYPILEKERR